MSWLSSLFLILLSTNVGQVSGTSNRLLITINSYSFIHWDSFDDIYQAYRDMCEGGWTLRVVVLTATSWSENLLKWSHRNMFCYRTMTQIPLEIREFNQSIGNRIVDYSRIPTMEYLNDFDVFYYGEADMIFTFSQLSAWIAESKRLKYLTNGKIIKDVKRCGLRYDCFFGIGFIRFWRKYSYAQQTKGNLMNASAAEKGFSHSRLGAGFRRYTIHI